MDAEPSQSWPHAPPHFLAAPGTLMVTAGTYLKQHLFRSRKRLCFLTHHLLEVTRRHDWQIEAWAVFSNHYHWIGRPPDEATTADSLKQIAADLHRESALFVNQLDGTPRRKVWHNYHESSLSYEKSYLARLNYVAQNPVKHGLVTRAADYPWCSAAWFEKHASPAFRKTVSSFKTDRVKVDDDF